MRPRRAFTLVELLVVVGIVAVLIVLLLPTLGKARQAARRTRAASDCRQLLTGYLQYTLAHDGALPWGYAPPTVNGVPVIVEDPRSGHKIYPPRSTRWPWRLARYVADVWPILHNHAGLPPLPQ